MMKNYYPHKILITYTFMIVSGCGMIDTQADQDKNTLPSKNCNIDINEQYNKIDSINNNLNTISDASFIDQFDQIYFAIKQSLLKEKTLGEISSDQNESAYHRDCSYQNAKLLNRLLTDKSLYMKFVNINTDNDIVMNRYKTSAIKIFQKNGAHLNESLTTQLKILKDRESLLINRFKLSIQEDISSISFRDTNKLDGLPPHYKTNLEKSDKGIYEITTQYPDYFPFMNYNHNEDLRKKLYTKMNRRAFPSNEDTLEDLLETRESIARLLGFDNYAAYSTSYLMSKTTVTVDSFLEKLNHSNKKELSTDINNIIKLQKTLNINSDELNEWNYRYVKTNHLKNQTFHDNKPKNITFDLDQVEKNLISFIEKLFFVKFKESDRKADWAADVHSYDVFKGSKLIGFVHFDLYSRPGKYQHAAVMPLSQGLTNHSLPNYVLVTNFAKPNIGKQMISIRQLETFLHELGHMMHGIFSGNVKKGLYAGLSMEWDFIEAPSQLLENWLWHWPTFKNITKSATGESPTYSTFVRLKKNRNFAKAIDLQRQISFAMLALELHRKDTRGLNLRKTEERIFTEFSPFKYTPNTHFYASFGHLGQYSSNYYTYLWSKSLSDDLFDQFKKYGLYHKPTMETYIQEILSQGGEKPAKQLLENFLGRPIELVVSDS